MIILRALKVRDCCCLGELVSIRLRRGIFITYGWVERLCWHGSDTDGLSIFHNDFVNLGVALEVQV
jgi:hypothetical protein